MRVLYNDKGKAYLADEAGSPIPPIPWQAGMKLRNSNGNVDQSSLGYQYTMQSTTFIRSKAIKQIFYEVQGGLVEYSPIAVGQGTYMEDIKTNVVFQAAGGFDGGYVGTAQSPSQLGNVGVATAPITAKIRTWAKSYQYSIIEVEKALAYNNWNIIEAKMEALTKHWQLGLQLKMFLGDKSDLVSYPGLLSNANVNTNGAVITQAISSMSPAQFQALIQLLVSTYFANSNRTRMPNRFLMPTSDFLGLATFVNPAFPMAGSMMIDVLEEAFKKITGNAGFKIVHSIYGEQSVNAGYWAVDGTNRYLLYNYEEETVKMDVPLNFLMSPANTGDNFIFTGVGQAQHTGCIFYRPAEGLYFDWAV